MVPEQPAQAGMANGTVQGFQFVERDDEEKFDYLARGLEGRDHNETQIVTTSNNERHAVNRWYRDRKGHAVDQVYLDERVCGNRNVRETGARNGEIGVVIKKAVTDIGSCQRPVFQVRFANNPMLPYYSAPAPAKKKEDKRHGPHPDIDWAYCLTGNKCQGSEWDNMCTLPVGP